VIVYHIIIENGVFCIFTKIIVSGYFFRTCDLCRTFSENDINWPSAAYGRRKLWRSSSDGRTNERHTNFRDERGTKKNNAETRKGTSGERTMSRAVYTFCDINNAYAPGATARREENKTVRTGPRSKCVRRLRRNGIRAMWFTYVRNTYVVFSVNVLIIARDGEARETPTFRIRIQRVRGCCAFSVVPYFVVVRWS